jgi:hypothetical protein
VYDPAEAFDAVGGGPDRTWVHADTNGPDATCAIDVDGDLWCWGGDENDQREVCE